MSLLTRTPEEDVEPQVPYAGLRWEYRVISEGDWRKAADLQAEFNRLGAEGWELTTSVAYGARIQATAAVFRRPV